MYEDKTLVCKECGKEFVFTAGEHASDNNIGAANGHNSSARKAAKPPSPASSNSKSKAAPHNSRLTA